MAVEPRWALRAPATGCVGWRRADPSGSRLFSINTRSLANNVLACCSYYMLTIRLFSNMQPRKSREEEKVDRFSRIQNHLHNLRSLEDDPLSRNTTRRMYKPYRYYHYFIILFAGSTRFNQQVFKLCNLSREINERDDVVSVVNTERCRLSGPTPNRHQIGLANSHTNKRERER